SHSLNFHLASLSTSSPSYIHSFPTRRSSDLHRPLIAQLCELAGCQLPSMSNLNRIRSQHLVIRNHPEYEDALQMDALLYNLAEQDRKSTRLNSSHVSISYAVFCLKKKKTKQD